MEVKILHASLRDAALNQHRGVSSLTFARLLVSQQASAQ
jgi:hypothetical protein